MIPFQRLVFIDQYKNEQSFIALYSENDGASKGETDYHVRGHIRWFYGNDGLTHALLWYTMEEAMNRNEKKTTPACGRCGKCCLADMIAYVTHEDLARRKSENRQDILHIIENEQAVWLGDHFISARTGRPIYGCPFLEVHGGICTCSIYETRPKVCADYQPGSSQICPQWEP